MTHLLQEDRIYLPYNYCRTDLAEPAHLLNDLLHLREKVVRDGQEIFQLWKPRIARSAFLQSALNLAYYLILRNHDLRAIQMALMPLGLSSLGRLESRVLTNLDAVISSLGRIASVQADDLPQRPSLEAFFKGEQRLQQNTDELFGPMFGDRAVRIMVTMPSEAAENYELVRELLKRGMNCVRINCAHDTQTAWSGMVQNVRRAELETGQRCKVLMDLSGPKPRTVLPPDCGKPLRVRKGDTLFLAKHHCDRQDNFQPVVYCSIPEAIDRLEVGHQVWIDDGKIGAIVLETDESAATLRITYAKEKGSKLRSQKGLNFPNTNLNLSPLTPKDIADLDFVVPNADIIGYSFVQTAGDIALLQGEIAARLHPEQPLPGTIAKIETPLAVRNLPEIVVQSAGKQPLGIMIARGDLAIEIGYQRLAEIQEEILWICEASHIPVIWATQVLEQLVKQGIPSRAEMTDAAMAERAECVMLNKGGFICDAVSFLDGVLRRMKGHQFKKTPQLRALQSWKQYFEGAHLFV